MCCYWECKYLELTFIAVTYKSICWKGYGDEVMFGHNDKSWSLFFSTMISALHNNVTNAVHALTTYFDKLGVFMDHYGGSLSF